MDKQSFTSKYLPAARMAGELYGLNPVVILAQSAIETGWGESTLATSYNNFFGLTGYGVVNAYWHGGKTDLDKPGGLLCRRYDRPENSFLDFAPPDLHGLQTGGCREPLPPGLCPRDCLQPVYQ